MKMKIARTPGGEAYSATIERLYKISKVKWSDEDIAIDIGAHVGIFSIKIAIETGCLIHAYEPHPKNFNDLLNNIKLNALEEKVRPFEEAVWRKDGEATLRLDSNVLSDSHTIYDLKDRDKTTIKTVSPRTLFRRIGDKDICYLKVNCEGGEYFVLKYLADNSDYLNRIKRLCIEIHPDLLEPDWRGELIDILEVIVEKDIPKKIMFASKWIKNTNKKLIEFKRDEL